jgi:hypothetical protein
MRNNLRVLVDTLCGSFGGHVPVSAYWYTSEDRSQDGCQSACYADAHNDVDGDARPFQSEYAPILKQN